MSDIFISYARPDRERARQMAAALEQRGWSVWWDHEIPPGRNFDDVIEEALAEARCVVVLWSQASTASGWVRNEASEAMQRQVLIPALIDADVKIPLGFRRLQAADLSRWNGESSVEFEQFCEAVASNVGAPSPPVTTPAGSAEASRGPRQEVPMRAAPPPAAAAPAMATTQAAPTAPSSQAAAPAPKRTLALWIGGAVGVLVLAGIASLVAEQNADRVPQGVVGGNPANGPAANPGGAPFNMAVAWRDNALMYAGSLSWDGRANAALLAVEVGDGKTRRSLGQRQVPAYGHADPAGSNAWIFSSQIAVAGDSQNGAPHSHNVNLYFEPRGNGGWVLVRNCTAPGDCYETNH